MSNGLIIPSYATGYAHNAGEAMYPQLHDGLVANYDMGLGATGLVLKDTTSHQSHGALTSMDPPTDWVPTEVGMALDFDGSNDHVNLGNLTLLEGESDFTLVCLAYWRAFGAITPVMSHRLDVNNMMSLTTDVDGRLYFVVRDGGAGFHGTTGLLSLNTWYHIACVFVGNVWTEIYINGLLESTKAAGVASVYPTVSGLAYIAKLEADYLNGRVALVGIRNRALGADEIALLHRDVHAVVRLRERIAWKVPATVTTYLPNSANCVGWDGFDDTRPPAVLAMDTEVSLDGAELNTISADDANSIIRSDPNAYPGQHLRLAITETPGDVTQIDVLVRGYGAHIDIASTYEYYLYIWDADGSTWEAMANHATGSKDTLTDSILANFTNYIHNIAGTNYVDILLVGPGLATPGSNFVYTYYAELVITSGPPSFVPYIIMI